VLLASAGGTGQVGLELGVPLMVLHHKTGPLLLGLVGLVGLVPCPHTWPSSWGVGGAVRGGASGWGGAVRSGANRCGQDTGCGLSGRSLRR
jgi:hypothetical protein